MKALSNSQKDFSSITAAEAELLSEQFHVVKDLFQTISCHEMIESVNTMVESFLFDEGLENVSVKMRGHIANNLRLTTFLASLDEISRKIMYIYP
ncbi:MAG: hypothetical protein ABIN80_21125 [Dyadobacter sp.]|uniref:hypothetical protein n=1 Tax=Dyadobacter sp. TaxID=1914288 RepID=UPI0032639E29